MLRWLASGTLAGLAVPGIALAQVPPAPGQVIPPTREEIDPAPPPAAAPRLTVEGDIERAPCPLAAPAYADIRVTISEVQFNNLKGASPEELRSAWAPYVGQSQPIAVVCEIRDTAATILRAKGYLAAVQVPTQRIENGVVRFEVLYARLTAIRVRGEASRAERLIAGYLEHLTDNEIFNRLEAERYLLLARDLPGHDIRLTLKSAETGVPGELIGEVTVLRTPFEVDLNIQNLASRDTGRWGGQLRAQFYGLTGMGDRTTLALFSTADFDEQQVVQIGHDFRVGSEGLGFSGRLTHAWTKPDIGALPGAAKVTARTLLINLETSYPFVRTRSANLYGALGLDYLNQDVDFIGPLSRDHIRVGYLRLSGDMIDPAPVRAPRWRASGSVELRRGLSILNASNGCGGVACAVGQVAPSRLDGDPTATVIRAAVSGEYVLIPELSAALTLRGQHAFDPLFSFEEFSAGNYTVGRGYEPGIILGDSGLGVQFELRGPRIGLPGRSQANIQPFGFVDSAWVWNKDRPGALDPQKLTSVGGGVRASLANRFRLEATLAVPTRRAGLQARNGDVRLLISLSTLLLPWGAR